MNDCKKCEYTCRNKKTCTLPIFYELISKDNDCVCNECIVKVKCETPCSPYKKVISTNLKASMSNSPNIMKEYVELRRSYLQSIMGTLESRVKIVKADTILNPSYVTVDIVTRLKRLGYRDDEAENYNKEYEQGLQDQSILQITGLDPRNIGPNKMSYFRFENDDKWVNEIKTKP